MKSKFFLILAFILFANNLNAQEVIDYDFSATGICSAITLDPHLGEYNILEEMSTWYIVRNEYGVGSVTVLEIKNKENLLLYKRVYSDKHIIEYNNAYYICDDKYIYTMIVELFPGRWVVALATINIESLIR